MRRQRLYDAFFHGLGRMRKPGTVSMEVRYRRNGVDRGMGVQRRLSTTITDKARLGRFARLRALWTISAGAGGSSNA
jgi:hypothetical protein